MDSDALVVCEQASRVVQRDRTSVPVYVRWLGLSALIGTELFVLSIRFDAGSLVDMPQWWAKAMGVSPMVPSVVVAILTAAIIIGGIRLKDDIARLGSLVAEQHHSWLGYLFLHFLSFATLTALTWFIFEGGIEAVAVPGLWLVAWVAAAAGTLAFWAAAIIPPSLWITLVRQTRRTILLGAAIGAAAVGCGGAASRLWEPLGLWTFEWVRGLLSLVVPQCVCLPSEFVVGTPTFSVCIDKACSGYQGIGLVFVFFVCYLGFYRRTLRFPNAILLVPLGIVAIWLANVLRIVVLILIGTWFSPSLALGGFHSQAGWIAFNAIALGLVFVADRLPFFNTLASVSYVKKRSNPSVPYLAPFLAGLAVAMVAGALCSRSDCQYPIRVVAVAAVLWYFRGVYAGFRWGWSWEAVGLGVLTAVLWILLASPGNATTGGFLPSELAGMPAFLAAGWCVCRFVGYVIVTPAAEELAFRGYLTRRLISADFEIVPLGRFSWLSFFVSSALFGVFHGRSWFAGCLAGTLFAMALYRRGRIADAVLAHATANAAIATYAIATRSWNVWS